MKLTTKELRDKLPKLYSQENTEDPVVYVKYFLPFTRWYWYVTEFDGEDMFFGFVVGDYPELGYFALSELESIRGPYGASVERDLGFEPIPLSQVKKLHEM